MAHRCDALDNIATRREPYINQLTYHVIPLCAVFLLCFSVGGVMVCSLGYGKPVPRDAVVVVSILFGIMSFFWLICRLVLYQRDLKAMHECHDIEKGVEKGVGNEPQRVLAPRGYNSGNYQDNNQNHQQLQYQQYHHPQNAALHELGDGTHQRAIQHNGGYPQRQRKQQDNMQETSSKPTQHDGADPQPQQLRQFTIIRGNAHEHLQGLTQPDSDCQQQGPAEMSAIQNSTKPSPVGWRQQNQGDGDLNPGPTLTVHRPGAPSQADFAPPLAKSTPIRRKSVPKQQARDNQNNRRRRVNKYNDRGSLPYQDQKLRRGGPEFDRYAEAEQSSSKSEHQIPSEGKATITSKDSSGYEFHPEIQDELFVATAVPSDYSECKCPGNSNLWDLIDETEEKLLHGTYMVQHHNAIQKIDAQSTHPGTQIKAATEANSKTSQAQKDAHTTPFQIRPLNLTKNPQHSDKAKKSQNAPPEKQNSLPPQLDLEVPLDSPIQLPGTPSPCKLPDTDQVAKQLNAYVASASATRSGRGRWHLTRKRLAVPQSAAEKLVPEKANTNGKAFVVAVMGSKHSHELTALSKTSSESNFSAARNRRNSSSLYDSVVSQLSSSSSDKESISSATTVFSDERRDLEQWDIERNLKRGLGLGLMGHA
ncbi:uncharacterized protein BCR38DRAFT_470506 [Pseudomassariella vexata]|uniref:Uncharacterized protein n=1 Tax=Pseudomassariella vexata TaxID=1141098 RepID=A0A1Y2EJD4_9PEZI|nr:uncharacterized protein BCR38DRAFT_470506 [Pseudomassariella vexata]ORY71577.1 hypothetical protein BCR38DRAFT_470506 [Pseudomassariella vexata]